jgi:hypothetical protein
MLLTFLMYFIIFFSISRAFSLFGGKWSPFAKTHWKLDLFALACPYL